MQFNIRYVLLFLFALASSAAFGQMNMSITKKDTKPYKNRALIIGTDHYSDKSVGNLNNPVFDARSVKETLEKKYGFEATTLIDKSKDNIIAAIKHLQQEVAEGNAAYNTNLFVFIAGHGKHSDAYGGYIIPADATNSGPEKSGQYIYYTDLDTMIDNIPAKHIMVMLDVCYGGTFNESFKRKRGDNANMYADKTEAQIIERRNAFVSRKYVASGGKEQVNDGAPDKHSPFVDRLLKLMDDHYMNGQAILFTELCNTMCKMTNPTPVFDNFGMEPDPAGDFILQPLPNPNAKILPPAANNGNGNTAVAGPVLVVVIPKESGGKNLQAMLDDQDVRLGLSKVQELLESKGIKTVSLPSLKPGNKVDAKTQLLKASGANVYVEVDFAKNIQQDTYSLTVTLNAATVSGNNTIFYKACPSGYFRTTDYGILTGRALKTGGDELAKKIAERN